VIVKLLTAVPTTVSPLVTGTGTGTGAGPVDPTATGVTDMTDDGVVTTPTALPGNTTTRPPSEPEPALSESMIIGIAAGAAGLLLLLGGLLLGLFLGRRRRRRKDTEDKKPKKVEKEDERPPIKSIAFYQAVGAGRPPSSYSSRNKGAHLPKSIDRGHDFYCSSTGCYSANSLPYGVAYSPKYS